MTDEVNRERRDITAIEQLEAEAAKRAVAGEPCTITMTFNPARYVRWTIDSPFIPRGNNGGETLERAAGKALKVLRRVT